MQRKCSASFSYNVNYKKFYRMFGKKGNLEIINNVFCLYRLLCNLTICVYFGFKRWGISKCHWEKEESRNNSLYLIKVALVLKLKLGFNLVNHIKPRGNPNFKYLDFIYESCQYSDLNLQVMDLYPPLLWWKKLHLRDSASGFKERGEWEQGAKESNLGSREQKILGIVSKNLTRF